ncbi:MAG: hypothetical protein GXP48_03865, partial [Acidobacteria bacterium]|nr:hypothetical protein [Acidobacteriota bacterium]
MTSALLAIIAVDTPPLAMDRVTSPEVPPPESPAPALTAVMSPEPPEPCVSSYSISSVDGSWLTVPLPTIDANVNTFPEPESTFTSIRPPSTVRP